MRRRRNLTLVLAGWMLAGCGGSAGVVPATLRPLGGASGLHGGASLPGSPDSGSATSPVAAGSVAASVLQVEQAVLANIAADGFDSVPGVNGGLGALWINWRTGSDPLTTNWNNTPAPECSVSQGVAQCAVVPPRTDRLTDLRYLHNLALYRSQHPGDSRFDAQLRRWEGIVKSEWQGAHDARGWTYDALADITRLTGDPWYQATASREVAYWSTRVFHLSCRCLYFTDAVHPQGYYRPVDVVEEAAALASEGARVGNQTYLQQARDALQFVVDHGFLRAWHAFPYAWDQVLDAGGAVNGNEVFAAGLPNPGAEVRVIWIGQEAQMLWHAARATGDGRYAALATELLDALSPAGNTLGLWDPTYGGYCEKVTFGGTSYANPGTPALGCSKKEAGRQLVVLDAARVAQVSGAGTRYDDLVRQMTALAVGADYYRAGQGYVYEVARNYSLYDNHGTPEDWVTTEADGIALEALFALSDPRPW